MGCGVWRIRCIAQQYRLNIGTIVEEEMLKVRLASVKRRLGKRVVTGGRVLGELEEWFLSQLSVGDTFLFAGEVLRFEGLDEFGALATRTFDSDPMIPSLPGRQVSALDLSGGAGARKSWPARPSGRHCRCRCRTGLPRSAEVGHAPRANQMLVETFPRAESTTSSATPLKAGWPSKRLACC